jgi:ZIP family zinc transporter
MIAEVLVAGGGSSGDVETSWIQTTTMMAAPTTTSTSPNVTPLLLSTLAGLSTCLGAAVVFWTKPHAGGSNFHPTKAIRMDKQLAFSLALAGSVMVTVSVASILPEAFFVTASDGRSQLVTEEIGQRVFSFGLGCFLYFLLSKFALPEPDAILFEEASRDDDDEPLVDEEIAGSLPPNSPLLAKQQSGNKPFQRKRSTLPNTDVMVTNNNHPVTINKRAGSNISSNAKSEDDDEQTSLMTGTTSSTAEHDYRDDYDKALLHPEISQRNNGKQSSSPFFLDLKGRDLENEEARRNWRVAMLLFISLLVHNFPEGTCNTASLGMVELGQINNH